MFSKLVPLLALTISLPALASFQPTGKPAHLHCQGSKGELTLEADQQQKYFNLIITIGRKTTVIDIDGYTAKAFQAQPDVNLTSFTFEDSVKNFVSVDASFTKPKWIPPSEGCMITRAGDCVPRHSDGYWLNSSFNDVSIGFQSNPSDTKTYIMNVLSAESYGIGGVDQKPLGETVVCTGELL